MLKWLMVRYKVKAGRAAENESYITAVFEQLKHESPPGISYASFKLADGVSFIHIAAHEEESVNPLSQLAAFKAFTAAIQDRCDEPPVAVDMQEIGFYSALGK
jgi:hypothetical protein